MSGAIKHIVLLLVAVIVVLFLAIPVLRRMEPHHDIAPPPVHDTSGVRIAPVEKTDSSRVRDEQEGASKPSATPGQQEWKPVIAWEGTGGMTTKRFTIVVHTWRISWDVEVRPELGTELFQVMVYDGEGALKSVAANTNRTDQGETILPGPGTYTLEIKTVQKWKVKVEEKG